MEHAIIIRALKKSNYYAFTRIKDIDNPPLYEASTGKTIIRLAI